jgi:hypothetical protein
LFFLSALISQQSPTLAPKGILEDPTFPTALFLLAAVGELLLLPGALGLYFFLQRVDRTRMFLLAIPMFLVSRGLIISLSQISGSYLDTANETLKAAYLASAELAIETQKIFATFGLVLLAVWSIVVGRVMLKGVFSKRVGYLVMAAGILIIFPPVGLALTAFWQLVVGAKLFKMGAPVE